MNPKVKFTLNKALDKEMALEFLDIKQGGVNFSQNITGVHPELLGIKKLTRAAKRAAIGKHFDSFYLEHSKYLNKKVSEFASDWQRVEKKFISATGVVFHDHPWPKGKYKGYISIVACNPRFLKDKTFQVFYFNPLGVRYVTAHEMLHFIFYDYTLKKYPRIFKRLNPNEGKYWDLAELFNDVILQTPQFIRIHGIKKATSYPSHRKYLPAMSRLWKKTKNIDAWITGALDILTP
jgi:hypothetical protein